MTTTLDRLREIEPILTDLDGLADSLFMTCDALSDQKHANAILTLAKVIRERIEALGKWHEAAFHEAAGATKEPASEGAA